MIKAKGAAKKGSATKGFVLGFNCFGFQRLGRRDCDGVVARIGGVEDDGDFFVGAGVDDQAGVVGGDGKSAAAAVNQNGEFDLGGAAMIEELIEGGFDGAAGLKDVIHEDHGGAGDINRDESGGKLLGDGLAADIVTVKRNVDNAGARASALGVVFTQKQLQAGCNVDAAVCDAEEDEGLGGVGGVAGGDGGGELVERASEVGGRNAIGSGHVGLVCADAQTRGKARSVTEA